MKTLAESEFKSGMAEIIKAAIIGDRDLFKKLNERKINPTDEEALEEIIARAVRVKKRFVETDWEDRGPRHILNFGHTYGHAIEALSGFTLPHGLAVAQGMVMVAKQAQEWNLIHEDVVGEIEKVLEIQEIPYELNFREEKIISKAMGDKKVEENLIKLAIPYKIGEGKVLEIDLKGFSQGKLLALQ